MRAARLDQDPYEESGDGATTAAPQVADPLPEQPPVSWRVDPTRRGALALVAIAAASVALTGGFLWRSRPRPVPVAPPTVTTTSAATTVVVVDVQGAVRRPGLVSVRAGARVADAITAAGGLKPGATTTGLNLARRVNDGEQVLVATPGSAAPNQGAQPAGAGAGGNRLDLNLATLEQLDALPGVGPVTARRILDWREENGRFASVDQLREVDGIGDKRFESLRELVTV